MGKGNKIHEIETRLSLYLDSNIEYDKTVSYSLKNIKNDKVIIFFNDKSEVDDLIKLLKESK